MAPRRLIRKDVAGMAAVHYPQTVRFRVIARTPTVFIDYLFEILLAGMSAILGLAYFTGFVSPNSVIRLLPELVAIVYSSVLLLGATVVFVGLATARAGTVVSAGLKLLVAAFLTYTTSVVWYLGLRAALSVIIMAFVFTSLAAWRSFILRSTFLLLSARGTDTEVPRED